MALAAVRGFRASISASISRFSPMAAVRAPTMASRIQNSWAAEGRPRAASSAPVKAKGRAKRVWENLIISRKTFIRGKNSWYLRPIEKFTIQDVQIPASEYKRTFTI